VKRETHERALLAAARVDFAAAAVGCGNQAEAPPKSAGGETKTEPKSEPSCKQLLHEAFPNGDPDWYGRGRGEGMRKDAKLTTCCEQMASRTDVDATELLRTSGCCHVSDWNQGIHCTPWGPPMPPVMRSAMRA
jgi:hypothetical protein